MAKKKAPKKKDEFYVAISHSDNIHIPLLQTQKHSLESINLFKEIKKIRKQKLHQKSVLRKHLKKITLNLAKIRSAMPHVSLDGKVPEVKALPKKKVVVKKPAPKPHHARAKLDKIESGLRDIEAKLAQLQR